MQICEEGDGMNESFDLQEYLSKGIEDFMADVLKATLKNPRESAFMLKFAAAICLPNLSVKMLSPVRMKSASKA